MNKLGQCFWCYITHSCIASFCFQRVQFLTNFMLWFNCFSHLPRHQRNMLYVSQLAQWAAFLSLRILKKRSVFLSHAWRTSKFEYNKFCIPVTFEVLWWYLALWHIYIMIRRYIWYKYTLWVKVAFQALNLLKVPYVISRLFRNFQKASD